MEIPEVSKLKFEALSKHRIQIGCAAFERTDVWKVLENDVTGLRCLPYPWFHGGRFYWVTRADCDRALRLMEEYQGHVVSPTGEHWAEVYAEVSHPSLDIPQLESFARALLELREAVLGLQKEAK